MAKGIVRLIYEVEYDTDDWGDYPGSENVEPVADETKLTEMVRIDEENFPEFWENNEPKSIEFIRWL